MLHRSLSPKRTDRRPHRLRTDDPIDTIHQPVAQVHARRDVPVQVFNQDPDRLYPLAGLRTNELAGPKAADIDSRQMILRADVFRKNKRPFHPGPAVVCSY